MPSFASGFSGGCRKIGPRLAGPVDRQNLVAHRVAQHVEIASAAVPVTPAFRVRTFGVGAHIEKIGPLLIAGARRIRRPGNMRFAAVAELDLSSRAAIGTPDQEHGRTSMRDGCRSRLVDETAGAKTIQVEWGSERMRFATGNGGGEHMTGSGRGF